MTALNAETRAVIAAVLEAVAIPHAATDEHDQTREAILRERLLQTVLTLEFITDRDRAEDLTRELAYLRVRLAEHPATGYVTHDQARERIAAGASWMDAVRLDYSGGGDPMTREGGRR